MIVNIISQCFTVLLNFLSGDNKFAESGAVVLQQEVGVPNLHDVAVLHHEDAVTAEDSVHPVGDGEDSSVCETMLDHLLYNKTMLVVSLCSSKIKLDLQMQISVRVHIGGGLVNEDDLTGGEDGPDEAEQLLLAGGEAAPLLPDSAAVP